MTDTTRCPACGAIAAIPMSRCGGCVCCGYREGPVREPNDWSLNDSSRRADLSEIVEPDDWFDPWFEESVW
jgi:hypothetical protein